MYRTTTNSSALGKDSGAYKGYCFGEDRETRARESQPKRDLEWADIDEEEIRRQEKLEMATSFGRMP